MNNIGITLTADNKAMIRAFQEVEKATGGMSGRVKNSFKEVERSAFDATAAIGQMKTGLLSLAGGVGLTQITKQFVQTADAMALLDARLKNAIGTGEDYARAQQDIYKIAQANNLSLQDTATLYTKLHEPVKRLGGTAKETTGIVEAFALSLRLGGANTQEAAAATLQFAQAMGSGKLQGDEFRSMAEASPRFMKALADGMGVPIESLKEMGSEGKLTADIVGNALVKSLAVLKSESGNLPDTVGGAFQRVKNEATLAAVAMEQATGASGGFAEILGGVADQVKIITAAIAQFGAATKGMGSGIDFVGGAIKVVGAVFETVIVLGAEAAFMIRAVVKNITDLGGMAAAFQSGGLDGLAEARARMRKEDELARTEHDKFTASVTSATTKVLAQRDALKNNSLSAAENSNEMQRLINQHGQVGLATLKSSAATKDSIEAQKKAAKEAERMIEDGVKLQQSLTAQDSGLSPEFAKQWDNLGKAYKANKISLEQLLEAQKLLLDQQPFVKKAAKDREDAAKEMEAAAKREADGLKITNQLREDSLKPYEQSLKAQQKRIEALENEEKAIAISEQTNVSLAQAVEMVNIARLEEQITLARAAENFDAVAVIEREIEERKKLAQLIGSKEARDASAKAAKQAADDWQKAAEKIEDSITDALMRGFEGGKGFVKNLVDTIKNMFSTMVLRPVVQGVVSAGLGAIGLGGSGPASASGLGGMASNLSSLAGLTGVGTAFGSTLATGFMSTLTGSGGAALTAAGEMIGLGSATGISSGLGLAAGAVAPYLLAALAVIAIWKKLDTSGTIHTGGSASFSAADGLQTNIAQSRTGFAYIDRRAETETFAGGIAQSIVGLLDSTATAFGKQAGYSAATAFADDSSKDGAWGSLVLSKGGKDLLNWADTRQSKWAPKTFADGEEGIKQYMAAVGKDVRDMLMQETPDWADAMLRALGDAPTIEQLGGVVQQITAIQNIFTQFGEAMPQLKGITDEAVGSLMQLAGGVGNLQQGLSNYVNLFYSDAEKQALATKSLSDSMAALGLSLPATNAEFRKLVEAQDLNTEAGRRQYAALIALAPAFDQVSKAAEAAQKRILDERIQLENQLLELQGNTVELRRREREKLDASNQALYDQIKAQEDAKAAQERYTQAVENARTALATAQQAVAAAQGNVDAIRQQGTSAYISALQQVQSIQDQIAQEALRVANTYRDLGKSLREYVDGVLVPPSQSFAQALTKALAGDSKAMSDLPGLATAASDQARNAAGTSLDFRRQQAQIMRGVLDAAAKAESLAAATAAEEKTLQQRLIDAQIELAEALRVANAIGAPLAQTQANLITQYQQALQALSKAQADEAVASARLSAIERNTAASAQAAEATLQETKEVVKEIKNMGATISVGGLVRFDPNDPIRGVFDNISRTNNILNQQFIKWLELQSGSIVQFNDATGKIDISAIKGFETTTNRGAGDANFPGLYVLTYDSTNYLEQIRDMMGGVRENTGNTFGALNNLAFGHWSMLVRGFGPGQSVPVSFKREYTSAEFFATGGAFSNGIVTRPTGFNMGMMGEVGPEAIMPLTNVGGSLGVRAQMPGMDEVAEEIRALRQEVAMLRAEARATAINTGRQADLMKRVTRNGEAMTVMTDIEPLEVTTS